MLAMEPENVPEAAARIAQLEAEVERLTRDRISGSELKRWAAKHTAFADRIAQLEAALREIKELPGELNPSNYTHDDVCACNDAFVRTWQIASAALGEERT
jgi:hypothetical protein